MNYALLLHLPLADYPIFRRFGIAATQTLSWNSENMNKEGLVELFYQVGAVENKEIPIIDASASAEGELEFLNVYFENFVKAVINKKDWTSPELDESPTLIIFNIMPFHLSATLVDKIAQGLWDAIRALPSLRDIPLVFLTRNIDWFNKSAEFERGIRDGKIPNKVTVIDVRGYAISFPTKKKRLREIPRSVFRKILQFREGGFYRSLIYETNTYIGHFELKNSHTRTHYDLSEFVQRDNVSEHLCNLLSDLIKNHERVTIIGVGLEKNALVRLGYQFQGMNLTQIHTFEPFFSMEDGATKAKDWFLNSDCIVVLTDIVNSGKTLESIVSYLSRFNNREIPIKLFAIVKMENSPEVIEKKYDLHAAITVKRKYYPVNKDECPLCQLNQPIKGVVKFEDFQYVDEQQLTPFDFWEIVKDANALVKSGDDPQGRQFLYRVDTKPIFKKYRCWLKNVIREKYDSLWPHFRPNAICTVEEEPGLMFSNLVAEALDVDANKIVLANRSDLRKVTPSGLITIRNPFKTVSPPVLIVDDGINYGKTIEDLINFCRAANIIPMGVIVFDSRLRPDQMSSLEAKMGGNHILAVYSWPSTPVPGFSNKD